MSEPITELKGVGAKRTHALQSAGIFTVEDLLNYYKLRGFFIDKKIFYRYSRKYINHMEIYDGGQPLYRYVLSAE